MALYTCAATIELGVNILSSKKIPATLSLFVKISNSAVALVDQYSVCFRARTSTLTLKSGARGERRGSLLSIGTWRTKISLNHENGFHIFLCYHVVVGVASLVY